MAKVLICNIGFLRLVTAALVDGSPQHLNTNLKWLEEMIKVCVENGSAGNEIFYQLVDISSRINGFLMHFPQSVKFARDFTIKTATLLKKKYPLEASDSYCYPALLSNALLMSLLTGDNEGALSLSNQAVSMFPDDPVFMMNQAHCLALSGKKEKAGKIYEQLLDMDRYYHGKLSLGMYKDLCLLQKYGNCPASLLQIREQLTRRLKNEFEKGYTVTSVKSDSQAAKLGIHVGDQLFRYNGEPILDDESFGWERIASLWSEKKGDTVTIIRNGKQLQLDIQPGLIGVGLQKIQ